VDAVFTRNYSSPHKGPLTLIWAGPLPQHRLQGDDAAKTRSTLRFHSVARAMANTLLYVMYACFCTYRRTCCSRVGCVRVLQAKHRSAVASSGPFLLRNTETSLRSVHFDFDSWWNLSCNRCIKNILKRCGLHTPWVFFYVSSFTMATFIWIISSGPCLVVEFFFFFCLFNVSNSRSTL
jgi:hypothetical protein